MALQGAAPRVFISSAMGGGLADLRQEIAARLRVEGAEPFRFEEFQSEVDWLRASPAENENICLGKIEWSDWVLGLIGTSYGGSGRQHLAGVALTDLELFHALRLGKRMRVYVLDAPDRAFEVVALLEILRTVLRHDVVPVPNGGAIADRIASDFLRAIFHRRPPSSREERRRFFSCVAATMQRRVTYDDQLTGLRFLKDQFPPAAKQFDPDEIAGELTRAERLRPHDVRLTALWEVLQPLFAVPWHTHDRWLDLWDRCLSDWNKSAAWCGLHGLQFAGALSADNTLIAIRSKTAANGEVLTLAEILRRGERRAGDPVHWIRLYETGGALGSEYYSIAKLAPPTWRQHFLQKADNWCAVGERVDSIEEQAHLEPDLVRRSGRASIRGQVRLALGDSVGSLRLLEESLRWRREAMQDAESIGWAQVILGHTMYRQGQHAQGDHLVSEGLQALTLGRSPNFLVRAKKRVADVRLRQGRLLEAARLLDEAWQLAVTHHLHGQLVDLERLLPRTLRVFGRRFRRQQSPPQP